MYRFQAAHGLLRLALRKFPCKSAPGTPNGLRNLSDIASGPNWVEKAQRIHHIWQRARTPARLPSEAAREIAQVLCSTHGLELTALKVCHAGIQGRAQLDPLHLAGNAEF